MQLFETLPKNIRLPLLKGSLVATASIGMTGLAHGSTGREAGMRLAYDRAIDLFKKNMSREPDWDRVQVMYAHTTMEVICEIVEAPE